MVEYRRNLENSARQEEWHFHPECPYYPARSFVIAEDQVPDSETCAKCLALAGED